MTHILGIAATALALVPAPKEQVWCEGTCSYVEAEVRDVRDAALPPEGYRLEITTGGVTVASADDAGAFYARKTLKQLAAGDGGCAGARHSRDGRAGARPSRVPCDFADFARRMAVHRKRLIAAGVNCAPLD